MGCRADDSGTVVITGGILATVILLCIIAVLCYCRLQYYCCKKSTDDEDAEEEEEEEEEYDLSLHPRAPTCNACSSQVLDGRGNLAPLTSEPCSQPCGVASHCTTCSPYRTPFYIRTADMVPNGVEARGSPLPLHITKRGDPIPQIGSTSELPGDLAKFWA